MTIIGNYKTGSLIGQGAFGYVYSCKHKITNNDWTTTLEALCRIRKV